MKASQRQTLVDRIARELQSRYKTYELDQYLVQFGVTPPAGSSFNSKWVYSKQALAGESVETLLRIADDLDLAAEAIVAGASLPPKNWEGTSALRLFVSHISKDRDKAIRLRTCLDPLGIAAFVAHEDIKPTLEWQREIERALFTMDAFLAILTPGFSVSIWCQQETGFAIARGCKIISLGMGEDPTGFLASRQALGRKGRRAEAIADEIRQLLFADERTKMRLSVEKAAPEDDIPF